MSSSSSIENGTIYLYKNDPKVVNKGVNITNVRHAEGGFMPLLTDTPYSQRKFDNKNYNYNARIDHGSRPMHRTTFSLSHQPDYSDFSTHNSSVIMRLTFKFY